PTRAVDTARRYLQVSLDLGTTWDGVNGLINSLGVLARYGHHELCARADGYVSARSAIAYNSLGGMYRLSVADARASLGEEVYGSLAAEGATTDWRDLVREILDVLDSLSARP